MGGSRWVYWGPNEKSYPPITFADEDENGDEEKSGTFTVEDKYDDEDESITSADED